MHVVLKITMLAREKKLDKPSSIYYKHVHGLRTKQNILSNAVAVNLYPVIVLTETWLTVDYQDTELGLPLIAHLYPIVFAIGRSVSSSS